MGETSSPSSRLSPRSQEADSQCPICLSGFIQRAFTDPCFHVFCFPCILQWAKVSSSCPLCKASLTNIIYDIRANDLYRVYEVQPSSGPRSRGEEAEPAGSSDTRRFWYRSSLVPGQPAHRRRVQQRREAATEERRRLVYSLGLRVKPLSVERGRVRVRDVSASFFRHNPASVHRLIPWLARELRVLVGRDHVDFMVQLILSLVDKVDVESSSFGQHLRPFLHGRTDHFMHEFVSFAKSPYDMIAYDERSSYDLTHHNPSQEQPGPSGAPSVPSGDRMWPIVEPYNATATVTHTDNTLAGEGWESPPIHPGRDRPATQATPTPFDVIDITTPESGHTSQPTPTDGRSGRPAEEGGVQPPAHNLGHPPPLDHTWHQQKSHENKSSSRSSELRSPSSPQQSKHRSSSHRSRSPSHQSHSPSHRSHSHRSKHKSPSHRSRSSSHRSHSPSHQSKHKSHSHRSHSPHKSHSPSHRSHSHRSHSPSHQSKHKSHSHRSHSPSHRSHSHRSHSPSHRSHSHSHYCSRRRRRSPSVSDTTKSKGKERARWQRSHSRAGAVQDRSVSTSGVQEELSCVQEEIKTSRVRLLQGLLHEEKTSFLQSQLRKERQAAPKDSAPSLG